MKLLNVTFLWTIIALLCLVTAKPKQKKSDVSLPNQAVGKVEPSAPENELEKEASVQSNAEEPQEDDDEDKFNGLMQTLFEKLNGLAKTSKKKTKPTKNETKPTSSEVEPKEDVAQDAKDTKNKKKGKYDVSEEDNVISSVEAKEPTSSEAETKGDVTQNAKDTKNKKKSKYDVSEEKKLISSVEAKEPSFSAEEESDSSMNESEDKEASDALTKSPAQEDLSENVTEAGEAPMKTPDITPSSESGSLSDPESNKAKIVKKELDASEPAEPVEPDFEKHESGQFPDGDDNYDGDDHSSENPSDDISYLPVDDPTKLAVIIVIPLAFCVVSIATISFGVSSLKSRSKRRVYRGKKYEFLEPEDTLQV